jgi:hypothetical protein
MWMGFCVMQSYILKEIPIPIPIPKIGEFRMLTVQRAQSYFNNFYRT